MLSFSQPLGSHLARHAFALQTRTQCLPLAKTQKQQLISPLNWHQHEDYWHWGKVGHLYRNNSRFCNATMCTIFSPVTVTKFKGWEGIWDICFNACVTSCSLWEKRRCVDTFMQACKHSTNHLILYKCYSYKLKHGKPAGRSKDQSGGHTMMCSKVYIEVRVPGVDMFQLTSQSSTMTSPSLKSWVLINSSCASIYTIQNMHCLYNGHEIF